MTKRWASGNDPAAQVDVADEKQDYYNTVEDRLLVVSLCLTVSCLQVISITGVVRSDKLPQ